MGIFSKLFGKKAKDESAEQPLEFKQAVDFNTKFSDLLKADTFIARSNYKQLVSLATYCPVSKEEFLNLYGLGENSYNAYGQIFINAIKEFQKTNKTEG